MKNVDDATLTKFLIRSFSGIFEGASKRVQKPTIPGSQQHYCKEDGLVYLETAAGGMFRYKVDVSVLREETNEHIWYMSIVADINEKMLERINLPPMELRLFLMSARQIGFLETLESIGKNEEYCLFDISDHEEPAAVGGTGVAGTLKYTETIIDNLDLFRGEEFIRFVSQDGKLRANLYRASFQGGRL
ncbi:hypothetical protein K8R04_00470 [Candidatus Uhrbacteria bacterium]|nr:hypothetical protein [Candidatus Uhrbacteria bacterium]